MEFLGRVRLVYWGAESGREDWSWLIPTRARRGVQQARCGFVSLSLSLFTPLGRASTRKLAAFFVSLNEFPPPPGAFREVRVGVVRGGPGDVGSL